MRVEMCAYGLSIPGTKSADGETDLLSQKPTGLLTNIPEVASELTKQCDHSHKHGHLVSGTASAAQQYTPLFVDAIIRGLKAHLRAKGLI